VDWSSTRHPNNVTEDGVATLDDLIHYRGKTDQVCDFDIPELVLPFNAKYFKSAGITLNVNLNLNYGENLWQTHTTQRVTSDI